MIGVPGAAFGQSFGGYLCKRFQLKVRGMLKLTGISTIVVLAVSPILWARCEDPTMAGLLVGYPG